MSLDRFRQSHPHAYQYYRGKFVGRVDDGLKSIRASIMKTPQVEPGLSSLVPLNAQIQQLQQITRSAQSDQPLLLTDYVSKLTEFKAKYQTAQLSPKKSMYGSTLIQLLSEAELDGKFLKLINFKQLRREPSEYRKKELLKARAQQPSEKEMLKTLYREDLFDAAKDVLRKSRRSMEAAQDQYQPQQQFDLSKLKSRSVMELPRLSVVPPIDDILNTCDKVMRKSRRQRPLGTRL